MTNPQNKLGKFYLVGKALVLFKGEGRETSFKLYAHKEILTMVESYMPVFLQLMVATMIC